MRWPWHLPSRGEVITVIVCVGIGAVLLFGALTKFQNSPWSSNWGFGPDWGCFRLTNSQPFCIKKPTVKPSN
jgi:hypothetical protein